MQILIILLAFQCYHTYRNTLESHVTGNYEFLRERVAAYQRGYIGSAQTIEEVLLS